MLPNRKLMTLTVVHDHPKILLGMKKRGFGAGRWNGFGGKVEEGERVETAAKRELLEESGLVANDLEKIGVIDFHFEGSSEILEVHIFKTVSFTGEPQESNEMSPRWFFAEEIPFMEMWPDDRYWFPLFMRGKKFRGKFVFDGRDQIIDYDLKEVFSI